jgi:hypothetical protein
MKKYIGQMMSPGIHAIELNIGRIFAKKGGNILSPFLK